MGSCLGIVRSRRVKEEVDYRPLDDWSREGIQDLFVNERSYIWGVYGYNDDNMQRVIDSDFHPLFVNTHHHVRRIERLYSAFKWMKSQSMLDTGYTLVLIADHLNILNFSHVDSSFVMNMMKGDVSDFIRQTFLLRCHYHPREYLKNIYPSFKLSLASYYLYQEASDFMQDRSTDHWVDLHLGVARSAWDVSRHGHVIFSRFKSAQKNLIMKEVVDRGMKSAMLVYMSIDPLERIHYTFLSAEAHFHCGSLYQLSSLDQVFQMNQWHTNLSSNMLLNQAPAYISDFYQETSKRHGIPLKYDCNSVVLYHGRLKNLK